MGRKKVTLEKITSVKDRAVTFLKRRFGLFKKAHELSILCDCHISLIIVDPDKKRCFQYASESMQTTLDHFNACLRAAHEKEASGQSTSLPSSSSGPSHPTGFRSSSVPALVSFNNEDMRHILSGKRRSMAALSRAPSMNSNKVAPMCESHDEALNVAMSQATDGVQDCDLSYLEDLLNVDMADFDDEEDTVSPEMQMATSSASSLTMPRNSSSAECQMTDPSSMTRPRESLQQFLQQLRDTQPSMASLEISKPADTAQPRAWLRTHSVPVTVGAVSQPQIVQLNGSSSISVSSSSKVQRYLASSSSGLAPSSANNAVYFDLDNL